MRSMVRLPSYMRMYPQFLREARHCATNNVKEHHNLEKARAVWRESSTNAHWRNRRAGQSFFSVFNLTITHESSPRSAGRMDKRLDLVLSVRDRRYVYVRNYMPRLTYGQHLDYMFPTPDDARLETALRRGPAQSAANIFLGEETARGAVRPAYRGRAGACGDSRALELATLDRHNLYVVLAALNALDALNPAALRTCRAAFQALPRKRPSIPERTESYVPRLVDHILSKLS